MPASDLGIEDILKAGEGRSPEEQANALRRWQGDVMEEKHGLEPDAYERGTAALSADVDKATMGLKQQHFANEVTKRIPDPVAAQDWSNRYFQRQSDPETEWGMDDQEHADAVEKSFDSPAWQGRRALPMARLNLGGKDVGTVNLDLGGSDKEPTIAAIGGVNGMKHIKLDTPSQKEVDDEIAKSESEASDLQSETNLANALAEGSFDGGMSALSQRKIEGLKARAAVLKQGGIPALLHERVTQKIKDEDVADKQLGLDRGFWAGTQAALTAVPEGAAEATVNTVGGLGDLASMATGDNWLSKWRREKLQALHDAKTPLDVNPLQREGIPAEIGSFAGQVAPMMASAYLTGGTTALLGGSAEAVQTASQLSALGNMIPLGAAGGASMADEYGIEGSDRIPYIAGGAAIMPLVEKLGGGTLIGRVAGGQASRGLVKEAALQGAKLAGIGMGNRAIPNLFGTGNSGLLPPDVMDYWQIAKDVAFGAGMAGIMHPFMGHGSDPRTAPPAFDEQGRAIPPAARPAPFSPDFDTHLDNANNEAGLSDADRAALAAHGTEGASDERLAAIVAEEQLPEISKTGIERAAQDRLNQLQEKKRGKSEWTMGKDGKPTERQVEIGQRLSAKEQAEHDFLEAALQDPENVDHAKLAEAYGHKLKAPIEVKSDEPPALAPTESKGYDAETLDALDKIGASPEVLNWSDEDFASKWKGMPPALVRAAKAIRDNLPARVNATKPAGEVALTPPPPPSPEAFTAQIAAQNPAPTIEGDAGMETPAPTATPSIPDLPAHLAQAIAADRAPDAHKEHVAYHFGQYTADTVASTKPSPADMALIEQAKQHAAEQGWKWADVLAKVQEQLGLNEDFQKPGSHEHRITESLREQKAARAKQAALTDKMHAETQAMHEQDKQQAVAQAEQAAAAEQAKQTAEFARQADESGAEKIHDDLVRKTPPALRKAWQEAKTKKRRKELLNHVMVGTGTRNAEALEAALDRATNPTTAMVQQAAAGGRNPDMPAMFPKTETPAPVAEAAPTEAPKLEAHEHAALKMTQMKGAIDKGDGITFIPEALMTPQRRAKLRTQVEAQRNSNPRGGSQVQIKDWADVTGNPSDKGYAILDRRSRQASRFTAPPAPEAHATTAEVAKKAAETNKPTPQGGHEALITNLNAATTRAETVDLINKASTKDVEAAWRKLSSSPRKGTPKQWRSDLLSMYGAKFDHAAIVGKAAETAKVEPKADTPAPLQSPAQASPLQTALGKGFTIPADAYARAKALGHDVSSFFKDLREAYAAGQLEGKGAVQAQSGLPREVKWKAEAPKPTLKDSLTVAPDRTAGNTIEADKAAVRQALRARGGDDVSAVTLAKDTGLTPERAKAALGAMYEDNEIMLTPPERGMSEEERAHLIPVALGPSGLFVTEQPKALHSTKATRAVQKVNDKALTDAGFETNTNGKAIPGAAKFTAFFKKTAADPSLDKSFRFVARLLSKCDLSGLHYRIFADGNQFAGEHVRGKNGTSVISLNTRAYGEGNVDRAQNIAEQIIHETVHHVTRRFIEGIGKMTHGQKMAVKNLIKLLPRIRAAIAASEHAGKFDYQLSNEHEFMAALLSQKTFQRALNTLDLHAAHPNLYKHPTNALVELFRYIASMFKGAPVKEGSALHQAFDNVLRLIDRESQLESDGRAPGALHSPAQHSDPFDTQAATKAEWEEASFRKMLRHPELSKLSHDEKLSMLRAASRRWELNRIHSVYKTFHRAQDGDATAFDDMAAQFRERYPTNPAATNPPLGRISTPEAFDSLFDKAFAAKNFDAIHEAMKSSDKSVWIPSLEKAIEQQVYDPAAEAKADWLRHVLIGSRPAEVKAAYGPAPRQDLPRSMPESPDGAGTSTKNAVMQAERVERGQPEIASYARQALGTHYDAAIQERANNPLAGQQLVHELNSKPEGTVPVSPKTEALLAQEVLSAHADLHDAEAAAAQGHLGAAEALEKAQDWMNKVNNATKKNGYTWGAMGRLRQMMYANDMSEAGLTRKYLAIRKGEPLTEAQQAEVKALATEAKAAEDQAQAVQDVPATEAVQKIITDLNTEAVELPKAVEVETSKGLVAKLKTAADEARQRIAARRGRVNSLEAGAASAIATAGDHAIIGAYHLAELTVKAGGKAVEFAAWAKAMVEDLGNEIKPQLKDIFAASKAHHDEQAATVSKRVRQAKTPATPDAVVANAKKGEVTHQVVVDLARSHLTKDMELNLAQLLDRVHADAQRIDPSISRRDVQDKLSNYGVTSEPSKLELEKRLSELKSQARLTSSLNRAEAGITPLRTGFQPGKPSHDVRELQRKVKEAMIKAGIETTKEGQLASRRDAIVSRLKNQVQDLNREMQGKGRPKTPREQVKYDDEMNALVKERDELQAYMDDLTGPSPEGKWNAKAEAAAKASAEHYKRRIASGDLSTRKGETPFQASERTKAAQAEAKAAKAEFNALRESSGIAQKDAEAATNASLAKRIMAARERLAGKTIDPVTKKPLAMDAEGRQMKRELDRLHELLKTMQGNERKPLTRTQRMERATVAAEKAMAEIEKELESGQRQNKTRPEFFPDAKLRALQAELASLREIRDAAREAQIPRRSVDEIARDEFTKRNNKLAAELEAKLKSGDIQPKKRTPKEIQHDADSRAAQLRVAKARQAIWQARGQWELDHMPQWRKVSHATIAFKRAAVLLTAPIYAKLAIAGNLVRPFMTLLSNTAGTASAHLFMSEAMKGATSESGASGMKQFSDYARGMKLGLSQMKQAIRAGGTDNQLLYRKQPRFEAKPTLMDKATGHTHASMKAPAWEAAFAMSEGNRIAKAGFDSAQEVPADQLYQMRMDAAKDADRAIYTNENAAVKGYQNALMAIERSSDVGAAVADLLRVDNIIVKIPTNLLAEGGKLILGVAMAPMKLALLKARQEGKISPEQYNDIARTFKQSAGFWALAAVLLAIPGGVRVGGQYIRGEKRKKDDLQPEEIELFGHKLPHVAAHAGVFTAANALATAAREADKAMHPKKGTPSGLVSALLTGTKESGLAMIDAIPFKRGTQDLLAAYSAGKQSEAERSRLAKGLIPAPIRLWAELQDNDSPQSATSQALFGVDREHTKYRGAGFQTGIPDIGIPWLPNRKQPPVKKH